jgi:uncharacterized OB-fold protein
MTVHDEVRLEAYEREMDRRTEERMHEIAEAEHDGHYCPVCEAGVIVRRHCTECGAEEVEDWEVEDDEEG